VPKMLRFSESARRPLGARRSRWFGGREVSDSGLVTLTVGGEESRPVESLGHVVDGRVGLISDYPVGQDERP